LQQFIKEDEVQNEIYASKKRKRDRKKKKEREGEKEKYRKGVATVDTEICRELGEFQRRKIKCRYPVPGTSNASKFHIRVSACARALETLTRSIRNRGSHFVLMSFFRCQQKISA
jgi:hypothetical protein